MGLPRQVTAPAVHTDTKSGLLAPPSLLPDHRHPQPCLKIPKESLRREFSLSLSQGCPTHCTFSSSFRSLAPNSALSFTHCLGTQVASAGVEGPPGLRRHSSAGGPRALGTVAVFPGAASRADARAERVRRRGGALARGDGPPFPCSRPGWLAAAGRAGERRRSRKPSPRPTPRAEPLKRRPRSPLGGAPRSPRPVSPRSQLSSRSRSAEARPGRLALSAARLALCGRPACPGTFCSRPSRSPPPTTSCPGTSNWPCWAPAAWARAVSAQGTPRGRDPWGLGTSSRRRLEGSAQRAAPTSPPAWYPGGFPEHLSTRGLSPG